MSVKRSRFSYDILRGYKYIYKMEVENINLSVKLPSCYPIGCGVNRGSVTVEYDLCSLDDDRNISSDVGIGILNSELLLEASWCRIGEAREILNEEIFNDHVWNSPFTLGLLILKVWNDSASAFSIQCKMERTKLEWSPSLSKNIQEISLYFKKSSSCLDNKIIQREKEKNSSAIHFSNVELKLNSTDIFAVSNAGTVLAFRIDSFIVEKSILRMQFELDGLKVQHFIQPKKPFQCLKSSEIKNYVLNFRTVKFDYEDKETKIQLLKIIQINWSTTVHMTIFHIIEEMKSFKTKLVGNTISKSQSNDKMLNLSIKICGEMLIEVKLSKIHRLVVSSNDLSIAFLHNRSSFQAENLNICFNDYDIFIFKQLSLISFDAEEPNVIYRENFGKLELQKNKAWNLHIDEGKATFPYQYKFAEACSEQAVSIIKWLKLIHKREKKAFTLSSPLPADVSIKIKAFSMEIEDDPFEVKLRDNFELLEDEYHESLKRRRILDEKIEKLIKRKLLLPAAKLEELYATFAKKNAEIYIKRSQQLYQHTKKRTNLLLWKLDEIDIMFVADLSYHGKERVLTSMREIDDSSPFPEEEIEFCTLWCRMIQANISSITVSLRDFPQALIELRKLHIWGKLIGAEQEGSYRAKRKSVVEIDEPWSNVDIERNMGFLKFYHDLTWDMESLGMAYGVCWEPVVAQVVIAMENISKPSADPSPALPWWDKIRLLYHGRNTFFFQNLTFLLHASLDPYNTMEQMEIAWSDVIIEWTNAKIVTKGDLDIYVHTASKYDDCRLLHMPKLKLQFKLDWQCLGHPNEHFSVIPCAQDKVPEYSSNQIHDSYRAFRSENLNMIISLETKPVALETAADVPTMLLYSSTLRWIENLKIIHAGVTRLTRRGKLFSNTKPRKTPLGRHYRHIRLSLNLHKFQVCYWMSFAKQRGLELLGGRLSLSSEHVLSLIPIEDNLTHRPAVNWNISHLTCELGDSEIWLYNILNDKNNDENKSLMFPVERSYFLSVTRVSYGREAPIREIKTEEDDIPTHRLVVHGLKGAWTKHNRDVIFNLFDSYMKAKIMKRDLSTEALKGIKVDLQPYNMKHRTYTTTNLCLPNCQQPTSPMSHLQSGLAANMLQKLIAEAEANTMVYTEEIDCPNREQQLHGIAACQTDDVLHKNWLIELVNSQVMLKGSETSGYVIVSAAKSQILQRVHRPVWKDHTLVSKTTWVGSLECMQYYATVDAGEPGPSVDNIMWLSLDNIEERASMVISDLPDLVGSGHSVGGVVSSTVGGTSDPTTAPLQLQRIVSRCGCQFFYASYGENIDSGSVEVPPLPEDNDLWVRENAVDSFTLTHHDLDMCTNSLQYAMLLDLVNNLLLYVEPRKKEASEKLQRMRFQLELRSIDDLKAPILQLQNQVRLHVFNVRQLEREAYIIHRALNDNPDREDLIQELEQLEREVSEQKEQLTASSEELAMMISCFKEKQVRATKTRQRAAAPGQGISVMRRSEVCFKHARWRLTDADGQLGIADLVLNNFLYSKVTKSDDSVEHLLELGYVKMTNLLPNSHYKIVLQPTELQPNIPLDRQRALRIFCRERAPVGGIPVKEHLELNMIPITIGLTYAFVTTMLKFFFPGRNTEDHHGDDEQEGTLTRSKKRPMSHKQPSTSTNSRDDIEKMKERAEKNHTFLYIKIPEVPIKISYKGEKEKNIEDLHECGLVLPTLEYHDCTWTWLDLLMEMKNATKRVLVSQAIKQKLLKPSRPGTDETSQPQEEDKVRLLFGPKVIGNTEKSSKKSLLAKLQK
ncbi:protein hobbit [Centruroides vittatus]|uniref:protein hobbit n=1 Tax=Centruroides vittatus TaxID=120091 RepID=UPI00350F556F